MERFKKFISGIISGILIGISGAIYITILYYSNYSFFGRLIGAILFGIGLCLICNFGLWLFTGKIGFVLRNKPSYIIDLSMCLLGNIIGAMLIGLLLSFNGSYFKQIASDFVSNKLNYSILRTISLSILCGFMIYLAVYGFKELKTTFGKNLIIFICIAIFVICGFEHCIADCFYFSLTLTFSFKSLLFIFLVIIFNGVGSILLDIFFNLTKKASN